MQEPPHYLHLKHLGLFQPSSWPFCSSISTVDTADKFIYLNCALPSSAIIADKYLCFQNKLNAGFAAKSCLEWWKDPVLAWNLFSKSLGLFQLFFMILHRTAVSNSETDSSQAEEEDSPQFLLPAQEPGNLLTGLRKKHQPSISPSVGTLLIPWRDQQLTSEFGRSVSQHWKKRPWTKRSEQKPATIFSQCLKCTDNLMEKRGKKRLKQK